MSISRLLVYLLKGSLQLTTQSVKTGLILTAGQYLVQILMKSTPHTFEDPT